MNPNSLHKIIAKSSFWAIIGQFSCLFVSLISNIWLARLLSPKEFGQIGILMFFITAANILTESGLGGALIRKPKASKDDYSTIFIFNIAVSIICLILIIAVSKQVAVYYNDKAIQLPLIALSFVLIINAFQFVQNTHLVASMKYKKKSLYDLSATLISSAVGILSAYKGLGIWSLVLLYISKSFIKTILVWIFERFYFNLVFKLASFKELYEFGINTTLASALNIIFNNIYQLIIGKSFSISDVGFFYQAKKFNDVPNSSFITICQGPIFSGLSKVQENQNHFFSSFTFILSHILSILGFLTIILFYYADNIIYYILGSQWLDSTIYLRFLTATSFFYVLENYYRITYKIFNQTKKLLFIEIIKKIIQTITIIIGIYANSLIILLMGLVISNIIGFFINYLYSRSTISYFENIDLYISLKVLLVVIFFISSLFLIDHFFQISRSYSILIILIITPLYFIILKLMNICNITSLVRKLVFNNY